MDTLPAVAGYGRSTVPFLFSRNDSVATVALDRVDAFRRRHQLVLVFAVVLLARGRLSDAILAHALTNSGIALAVLAFGRWDLWA